VTSRFEIRPAVELGPIIVCLDTSGSMSGAREVIAKAIVLECMRGAHTQGRRCFVYAFRCSSSTELRACWRVARGSTPGAMHCDSAGSRLAELVLVDFSTCACASCARVMTALLPNVAIACSGPGEVKSLELDLSPASLQRLLRFLRSSFSGGTDVDRPFELSLARLQEDHWNAADILMVTDGEIRPPSEHVLTQVQACHKDMGLEVHGLLVGTQVTDAMKALCTHIHLFKSWSAVGGRPGW
jgi:uncharacterized protein with von Willebrand factor type A (vWA) domain